MAWTPDQIPDQAGRTAVVTGANGGIGFHTAALLAAHGAHVVLACRNLEKAHAAADSIRSSHPESKVSVEQLDLASLCSVADFAGRFTATHKTLDILVNNAGVMIPPYTQTSDGFELQFATNHLGHFALTGRLMTLLLSTPNSRVVNVSSLAHRRGRMRFDNLNAERRYKPWVAYGQSKLANLLFTYELDRRLRAQGASLTTTAAHPGFAATNITSQSAWMTKATPFFGQKADMGAWPTVRAATAPEAVGGSYWGPRWFFQLWGSPKRVGSSRASRDIAQATELWARSEALTGVQFLSSGG